MFDDDNELENTVRRHEEQGRLHAEFGALLRTNALLANEINKMRARWDDAMTVFEELDENIGYMAPGEFVGLGKRMRTRLPDREFSVAVVTWAEKNMNDIQTMLLEWHTDKEIF